MSSTHAPGPAAPARVFAGMTHVDTSSNPRLPILMDMVAAISRATEPQEVLRGFSIGMQRLDPPQGYVSLSTRNLPAGHYRITRLITDDFADEMARTDPWHEGATLPVHDRGFFHEIVRGGRPEILHDVFLAGDPAVGDALREFGSLVAIPLYDDGVPLNWAVMLHRESDHYTVKDLEDAVLRANLIGSTVRNVLAAQVIRTAHERARREMAQIARIQRALLPARLPDIPGVDLGSHYETFDTAGGDIYDFIPQRRQADGRTPDPHGPWSIQIADASGHGPAAATVVAMLNAILNASPDEMQGPAEMLDFANRHLCAKGLEGTFVTAILARYEPDARRFAYARAGHPPALLMAPADEGMHVARLDQVGGIPLGVMQDAEYEEHTLELRPGQTVVLYTDGISEALAPDGAMFEVAGIEHSLTECSGAPDCVINHVTAALDAHQGGQRPADDQTILVMRVQETGT